MFYRHCRHFAVKLKFQKITRGDDRKLGLTVGVVHQDGAWFHDELQRQKFRMDDVSAPPPVIIIRSLHSNQRKNTVMDCLPGGRRRHPTASPPIVTQISWPRIPTLFQGF